MDVGIAFGIRVGRGLAPLIGLFRGMWVAGGAKYPDSEQSMVNILARQHINFY